MLTSTQVRHYTEKGYVIPDFRLDENTVQSIRDDHTRFVQKFPQFFDYCGALLVYDLAFLNYARDECILNMVEQLLGPNLALWNSSLFAKPPKVGSKTPWHQDGEYWPIRPLATCSVWIAVDDSTRENGCLRFIPGSHRSKRLSPHHKNDAKGLSLPLELDADQFDESAAVDIELEAGQISLHDVYLMHSSEPNRSYKPRRGMTLRFMPTTSVYCRNLSSGPSARVDRARTLFLMRGVDVSGENDFRLRLPSDF
ncbi:MAG: phytanoyl-CoA dioxygenase family protein [Gammaproteobacteria bacterium]|nr:phytanoyl-CoA dioxygenase family protein [Gammaproteobacteria bacterium]